MSDTPPDSFDSSGLNHISKSTSPEIMLEMFDAELKHYLNSSRGCVDMLILNPKEEIRQRMLDILSGNLDKLADLRSAIRTYLDYRTK